MAHGRYLITFDSNGLAMLIMTYHGHLTAPTESGETEWQFFVDGSTSSPNGDAWARHKVKYTAGSAKSPVVLQSMRMIERGEHTVDVRVMKQGGGVLAHDGYLRVAVVPIADGGIQFGLFHHSNHISNGKGRFEMTMSNGATEVLSGFQLPLRRWFHYAATFDGFMIKVYTPTLIRVRVRVRLD